MLKWGMNVDPKTGDELEDMKMIAQAGKRKVNPFDAPDAEDFKDKLRSIGSILKLKSRITDVDRRLCANYKFFTDIDRNVRFQLYKSAELVHYPKSGTMIEEDIQTTSHVYIVLKGEVDQMSYKAQTQTTICAKTFKSGECFGDASIQKQTFDPLKCLNKDRNYLQTATDDVYAMTIPKQDFINAIFAEMRVELMFKILLFWRTPYFKDLSVYSLIMLASICDVKEYKYGEFIVC